MAARKKKSNSIGKRQRPRAATRNGSRKTPVAPTSGPVTLAQARALARARAPQLAVRRQPEIIESASLGSVAAERKKLELQRRRENERRIREYKATLEILKRRGVRGLASEPGKASTRRKSRAGAAVGAKKAPRAGEPLQIFAEGDSWFDYPVPLFGGGIIKRLENRLGVPILNLAKAGDEVRFMLGVEERRILTQQLRAGCPAGGPWDVLLFSGGGNDIVDNPMALWVREFVPNVPPSALINQPRFDLALAMVRAGYEDLIEVRDKFSPGTHLIFHAYDFAIPDGRGICHMGPWLKPTFDLRGFPAGSEATSVIKAMLEQFASMLNSLAATYSGVTFINAQGTLPPVASSWHNELHPSKDGFNKFADIFRTKLKALFPGRVL